MARDSGVRSEETRIPATDGYALGATLYLPPGNSSRYVLIAPAAGVKRSFYSRYARFLSSYGLCVITFDYRGVGSSRPAKLTGFPARMRDWGAKDLAGTIAWVRERGCTELLCVGHSAGSQVFGLAHNNTNVDALLTIAAQSGYWGWWPRPRRYQMAALWYLLVPASTRALGYFPGKRLKLSEDLPAGVALEWARWCRHPAYIVDDRGRPDREHFRAFRNPICSIAFEDDTYAPSDAVTSLLNCYSSAPKEDVRIQPRDCGVTSIGHFGFFRDNLKGSLWVRTANWLLGERPIKSH
jgi:predicted alpha/beta hydrolase